VSWIDRYLVRIVAGDVAMVTIAIALTLWLGPHPPDEPLASRLFSAPYWVVLTVGAGMWLATAGALGAYERHILGEGFEEFRRVVLTTVVWLGSISFLAFVTVSSPSRAAVLWMVLLVGGLSLFGRDLNRRWLRHLREKGVAVRRVLVVGSEDQATHLAEHLGNAAWSGYRIARIVGPGQIDGILTDPEAAIRDARADAIAVTDPASLGSDGLRELADRLEGTGLELLVVPSLAGIAGPRVRVRPVGGLPLLHLEEPRLTGPARAAKAVIDRVLALVLLVTLAVPMLLIGLVVRITSPGPALFRQVRVGLAGRPFTMYKFRSMVDGAEAQRDALARNDLDGPLFKDRDDPRVTRFGGWLRRHSLDELPQLWNVLKGEMSLVGPRPMLPSEVEELPDRAARRTLVKPGITGLWQVSGRSEVQWSQAIRLDLYYVENWSLSLDFVILLRTLLAVLQGRGAY
jgi:exopolysaccharide biosynthesis polyprenyl glycosylphosphotransferase